MSSRKIRYLIGFGVLLALLAGVAASLAVCPPPGEQCFSSGECCWCTYDDPPCWIGELHGAHPECWEDYWCLSTEECSRSCGRCSCCADIDCNECEP